MNLSRCVSDRWGPDSVWLTSWHAGPPSGRGGHPATDVVSPDSGLLGLPFLCGHRFCHLCRRHRVGLADGRRHGAVRALHQKERRAAGRGQRGGNRWDRPYLAGQERPWQREFENVTRCLNDLIRLRSPLDSHSASCQLPALSVKSNDTPVTMSLFHSLSSERGRRRFNRKIRFVLTCGVFSGDATTLGFPLWRSLCTGCYRPCVQTYRMALLSGLLVWMWSHTKWPGRLCYLVWQLDYCRIFTSQQLGWNLFVGENKTDLVFKLTHLIWVLAS